MTLLNIVSTIYAEIHVERRQLIKLSCNKILKPEKNAYLVFIYIYIYYFGIFASLFCVYLHV